MKKVLAVFGLAVFLATLAYGAESGRKVLILYDEKAQMDVLAKRLRADGYGVDFVSVKETLPDLKPCYAVIVFIHGAFPAQQAEAVIRYTQAGGRMIGLHHTISSGKVKTPAWLKFLGVEMPKGDPLKGSYGWEEGVDLRLVNLAPDHYITTHDIAYKDKTDYKRSDVEEPSRTRECVDFPDSEVYVNHQFTDDKEKTILYGFICHTKKKLGDRTWMQDRGGWVKRAGKGWIFYFMPGHTVREFENPIFQQIVANCLTWNP